MTGSHEVAGSIPTSSTNKIKGLGESINPFFIFKPGCTIPVPIKH